MENTKLNIMLGEKPCDVRMKENLLGISNNINESKKSEVSEFLYMVKGLESRKNIKENGIYEGSVTVLRTWEHKDPEVGEFNLDLYRIKRDKLDENKLEESGLGGKLIYNGPISKDDLELVRKGNGLKIKSENKEIKEETINESYEGSKTKHYLNYFLNDFKNKSGIKDLSWEELSYTLNGMGLKPAWDGAQVYNDSDVYYMLNNKINEFKTRVERLREFKNYKIEEPKQIKKIETKEKPKTLQDLYWEKEQELIDKRNQEKRERDEEMEKISQELIDKDNYGNKDEIDESFSNIFDSSLLDYSKEFEEHDKLIYNIQNWFEENCEFWHATTNGLGTPINQRWDNHGDYKINSDNSITIYGDIKILGGFEDGHLPDYINIKECKGTLDVKVEFNSFKGFPYVVWGGLYVEGFNGTSLKGIPQFIFGMLTSGSSGCIIRIPEGCSTEGLPILSAGIKLYGRKKTIEDIDNIPKYLGGPIYWLDYEYMANNHFNVKLTKKVKESQYNWYEISKTVGNSKGFTNAYIKYVVDKEHLNPPYNPSEYSYLNLFESFSNVFDSSLIDYSEDFEKQDERLHKIQQIKKWLKDCVYNKIYEKGTPEEIHAPSPHITYKINDDLSIDLEGYEISIDIRESEDYHGELRLPEYINFNKVRGNIKWEILKAPTSIEGFPKEIDNGTIYTPANQCRWNDEESIETYYKNNPIGEYVGKRELTMHPEWKENVDYVFEYSPEYGNNPAGILLIDKESTQDNIDYYKKLLVRKKEWWDWFNKYYETFTDYEDDKSTEIVYRKDIGFMGLNNLP